MAAVLATGIHLSADLVTAATFSLTLEISGPLPALLKPLALQKRPSLARSAEVRMPHTSGPPPLFPPYDTPSQRVPIPTNPSYMHSWLPPGPPAFSPLGQLSWASHTPPPQVVRLSIASSFIQGTNLTSLFACYMGPEISSEEYPCQARRIKVQTGRCCNPTCKWPLSHRGPRGLQWRD